jgi:hypothetical protein
MVRWHASCNEDLVTQDGVKRYGRSIIITHAKHCWYTTTESHRLVSHLTAIKGKRPAPQRIIGVKRIAQIKMVIYVSIAASLLGGKPRTKHKLVLYANKATHRTKAHDRRQKNKNSFYQAKKKKKKKQAERTTKLFARSVYALDVSFGKPRAWSKFRISSRLVTCILTPEP